MISVVVCWGSKWRSSPALGGSRDEVTKGIVCVSSGSMQVTSLLKGENWWVRRLTCLGLCSFKLDNLNILAPLLGSDTELETASVEREVQPVLYPDPSTDPG